MKINETTDMWVVVNRAGKMLLHTLADSKSDCKGGFTDLLFEVWERDPYSYRCIPVEVTIKERPL